MKNWSRKIAFVISFSLVVIWTSPLSAQQSSGTPSGSRGPAPEAPFNYIEPYGVALAPGIYLINFLFLYVSNPELAAFMPAYRAALPEKVYRCLFAYEDGCPYSEMERFFDEQAFDLGGSRNEESFWPAACQETAAFQRLAPRKVRHGDQINQPLGQRRADQLARLLGITQEMILTPGEFDCLIGSPPRTKNRDIIYRCTNDLTNSIGNADIPLSSYGLSLDDDGNVRSDCAQSAPCLEFNNLIFPQLELIARECKFEQKLFLMFAETPFVQFAMDGGACQADWELPACIIESKCAGVGGAANSCQKPLAND